MWICIDTYTCLYSILSLDKLLKWVHNFTWSSSNIWAIYAKFSCMPCFRILCCVTWFYFARERLPNELDAFYAKNKSSMSKRPISCFITFMLFISDNSHGLLICTLISENQGLFQTLEKFQVLQILIFFLFGTLIFFRFIVRSFQ